ncbi:MAG: Uma2 family endonuclease [Lewinellaceae bacterium]|nr:Uma2 family endonuclease [Lewinellaceae bacterium]
MSARTYSVADYLRIEQESGERHAFYNGTLEKMAGGTIAHNRISRNVLVVRTNALHQHSAFETFGSDQKIYLPKYNFYVYADVVVVAGEPLQIEDQAEAIINPILIIETLSASTERYDRGRKFIEYQSLPSFKEYVLLRQDIPEAMLFFREEPDVWRSSEVTGLDKDIWFRSIETGLKMAAMYDRVTF